MSLTCFGIKKKVNHEIIVTTERTYNKEKNTLPQHCIVLLNTNLYILLSSIMLTKIIIHLLDRICYKQTQIVKHRDFSMVNFCQ